MFYRSYLLPIFQYACQSWCSISQHLVSKLEIQPKSLLKILFHKQRLFPSLELYCINNTQRLQDDRKPQLCILIHRIRLGKIPIDLSVFNWLSLSRSTRNSLSLSRANSAAFTNSPLFLSYSFWLQLPQHVKISKCLSSFKNGLRSYKVVR